jgi:hypothetical protein
MEPRLTVFACDRSERWIISPGAGAMRQIELSNRSSTDIACLVRVEEPLSAAASPSRLVVPAQAKRLVDIVIGKSWDPASERQLKVILEDERGGAAATFRHALVPADRADFDLELALRSWHADEQAGPSVVHFGLWCVVRALGSVPTKVVLAFERHTSLRFPTPTSIALGSGETAGFEVPVVWDRSLRDERGWNHPPGIEAIGTADGQRRTAVLAWEEIEQRLGDLVTPDDRQARLAPAYPLRSRTSGATGPASQTAFRNPREERRLEQAVVASQQGLAPATRHGPSSRMRPPRWATFALGGLALAAVALALFFFLRPGTRPVILGTVKVPPLALSPAPALTTGARHATAATSGAPRSQAPTSQTVSASGAAGAAHPLAGTNHARATPRVTAALGMRPGAGADSTSAVVQLFGVEARYVPPLHALRVRWGNAAQAGALVQVLDWRSRVIASRSVAGATSTAFIVLPKGYRGQVAVEVTAFGRHGERVVQTASLSVGIVMPQGYPCVAALVGIRCVSRRDGRLDGWAYVAAILGIRGVS